MNGAGALADLERQACAWIRSLQRDHGATATPLPEKRRDHLAEFFPISTVERVRGCTVSEIPTRRSWSKQSEPVFRCLTST
jgi:hypothetical protein